MNRTLKLALGVVLGLGLVMPAFAQNFPDIPDNHWAYEALANLKGKILFGYPDGLYRPARPMSRAEFAAAINQLYQMMMAKDNQLQSAIDALSRRLDQHATHGAGGGGSQADIDALKRQVAEMQTRLNGMAAWGQDIANLKRLSAEFERELAALGVDMDAMKRDFADLSKRVAAIEKGGGGMGIEIHGGGDFVMIAGHSTDGNFGMTRTGRVTGYGKDDFSGAHVGMAHDLSFFHEFNTTLSGTSGDNVKWKASMTMGNMVEDGNSFTNFGSFDERNEGEDFDSDEDGTLYVDEMYASFDTRIAGQGFNATVGRYRHSSGAFFFSRPDYTEFYANSRWDDGAYVIDGAKLMFGFGSADLTVFGGKTGEKIQGIGEDSPELFQMTKDLGDDDFQANTVLGLELGFKLSESAKLRGVYLWQDSWDIDSGMNRMTTYGGELSFKLGEVDLYGTYAQTDFGYNTDVMLDSDNAAWAAWMAYDAGRWGFDGGFAHVEGNFGAYGSWGRLGTVWNPANIEGYVGNLWYKLSDRMKLNAGVANFEAADSSSGLFGVFSASDDSVESFDLGMDYKMNSAWNVKLGYETVDWDFGFSNPNQKWYTIGLDHNMSDAAKFSILYMMSDLDFDGYGGGGDDGFFGDPFGDNTYKGGVLSTQVSFKF